MPMKLITKEIEKAFERQGDTSDMTAEQTKIIAKLFLPSHGFYWYLYEYDPETRIAWGFANLNDPEMSECGTISIEELEQPFPVRFSIAGQTFNQTVHVERDKFFPIGKMSLAEVMKKVQNYIHV